MSFKLTQNADGSYAVFNFSTNSFLCNIPSAKVPTDKQKVKVTLLGSKRKKDTDNKNGQKALSTPHDQRRQGLRKKPETDNKSTTQGGASDGNESTSRSRLQRNVDTCIPNGSVINRPSNKKLTSKANHVKKASVVNHDAPPSSPEPDEECIDTAAFMRTVNLIPSDRFVRPSDISKAKTDFPLRRISRLPKHSVSNGETNNSPRNSFTIHDYVEDLDVCSPLLRSGIIPLNHFLLNPSSVSKAINNYERQCQTVEASLLAKSRGQSHQLRNRESLLKYSVTYRTTKSADKKYCHMFSFSVRQRRQRYQRLETGLSLESLVLMKHCKKTVLRVRLKRLTQDVIDKYLKNDTSDSSITSYKSNSEKDPPIPIENSCRVLQPVTTDVLENKEISFSRHRQLDSDVEYFFGRQNRSIGDEMRITKVHDWLNLLENCSPANNMQDTIPKKRIVYNGNIVAATKKAKSLLKDNKVNFPGNGPFNGTSFIDAKTLQMRNLNKINPCKTHPNILKKNCL